MSEKRKLRVIEVKEGRLPLGVSGRDLTGPIVLMEDGKLPPGLSEEHLITINATVLAVKRGEALPRIITNAQQRQYLQWGISKEKLEEVGYIIVDDSVIERGQLETEQIIMKRLKTIQKKPRYGD